MEDICILCNVIKTFLQRKSDQGKKMKGFYPIQAPNNISIVM
jgi:hypothetical protein